MPPPALLLPLLLGWAGASVPDQDLDLQIWSLSLGQEDSVDPSTSLTADPRAPDTYRAVFNTDINNNDTIVIEVTRSLAPLGADRFHALVKAGFYSDSALFRVVPGFVLQFGISGDPKLNSRWLHDEIKDDPVLASNTRGSISFATDGPNTRTSQVFINYSDNSRLDSSGFSPFGKVVSGLEVAEAAMNPTPGERGGVGQGLLEDRGNGWIRSNYPGVNFITSARIEY